MHNIIKNNEENLVSFIEILIDNIARIRIINEKRLLRVLSVKL